MKLYCPQCQKTYEGEGFELCPEDGARLFRLDEPRSEDPLLGAVVDGRFRIEELLGAGGMGAVYRGIQLSVNREVAIKVLRPELAGREQSLERFFREAKVVSELTHPNIVRLFEFGQDRERDLLYLVMELVRGADMGELLRRGRLRINLALEVIYQICGALTEPHARGIVHRDLKPENVVLLPISDGTLQVKVLDFGIARTLERGTQLTKTGMICGTPSYMAPEQAQNLGLDGRTDLYALGILLYEMLSGHPPFVGETSLQILLQHIQVPAPDLVEMMPAGSVPESVGELVRQLLEKDPERRPPSARAVRDRIDELRLELKLRPVRLEPDKGDEDPFDAWLLPRVSMERSSGRDKISSQDLGLSFGGLEESAEMPDGLSSADTLLALGPQKKSGESLAHADTLALEPEFDSAKTQKRASPETAGRLAATERVTAQQAAPAVRLSDAESSGEKTDQVASALIGESDKRRVIGAVLVALVLLVGAVVMIFANSPDGEEEVPLEAAAPLAVTVGEEPTQEPEVEELLVADEAKEPESEPASEQEEPEQGQEVELAEQSGAEEVPGEVVEAPRPAAPLRQTERQSAMTSARKEDPAPASPPKEASAQVPAADAEATAEAENRVGALERARQLREERAPVDGAPTTQDLQQRLRSLRGE